MIGIYDYTVILTYLSLLSASTGIVVSLNGAGHPYLGCFFLMLCGLCDAFDGMVARTKKNRTRKEIRYGIQIDSLSDLVAFGVLPTCIGSALIRLSPLIRELPEGPGAVWKAGLIQYGLHAVLVLYTLAALIRLAYFNVTEEERQDTEGGKRKTYTGLPVTSASLIFPLILLLHYTLPADLTLLYVLVALVTGFFFLSRVRVPKLGGRGVMGLVALGFVGLLIGLGFMLLR